MVINEPKPYLNHNVYVTRYAKYKSGGPKQIVIRDSQDAKYYVVKGHPNHGQGNGNNNNNNSNMKPTGNDNHNAKPSENTQVHKQNQPAKGNGGNNGSNKKH